MKFILIIISTFFSTCCLSQIQSPEIDSLGEAVIARLDSVDIGYITFDYKVEFNADGQFKKITFLKSDCDSCDSKAIKKLSKMGIGLMKRSYRNSSKDYPNTEFDPDSERFVISQTKFSIGMYNDLISKK